MEALTREARQAHGLAVRDAHFFFGGCTEPLGANDFSGARARLV
jgi:hypothetical protein